VANTPNPLSVRKSIVVRAPGRQARRGRFMAPAFADPARAADPAETPLRGHALDPLVREWLLELRVGGRSPQTTRWYECHYRKFRDRGGAGTLEEFTGQHVKVYLVGLQERGLADTSIRGVFLTLKCFANWAEREGYPVDSALMRLRTPRVAVKEMVTYSPEQLAAIDGATPVGWPRLAVRLLLGDALEQVLHAHDLCRSAVAEDQEPVRCRLGPAPVDVSR
jgi:hypothetical protein